MWPQNNRLWWGSSNLDYQAIRLFGMWSGKAIRAHYSLASSLVFYMGTKVSVRDMGYFGLLDWIEWCWGVLHFYISCPHEMKWFLDFKYSGIRLRDSSFTTFVTFQTSSYAVYKKMWNFMEKNPDVFVPSNDAGVARVRASNGRYAYLIESTTNEYMSNRQPCKYEW